jgi:hypothetical protein
VAVLALRALGVRPLATADELALEPLDRSRLPARLVQPVERQADADDDQGDQRPAQGAVELVRLQLVIVVVGLAVGRQLDLGTGL